MHHHILPFCLSGLFDDPETETVLFDLLDCISTLCSDSVDSAKCDTEIEQMLQAMVKFEQSFKLLMVMMSLVHQTKLLLIMVPECQPTNALVFGGANPVFARTAGQISAQNLAYVFLLFSEYYIPSVDPSG